MLTLARTIALLAALGVAGRAGLVRADEGDDLFRSAAEHYRQQQWQAACDDFARLLDSAPDHARANQARFHYGEALVQMGRYDEGRRQFDELLAHHPDERYATHALFRSGEAAYLAGDRATAKRQLEAFRQQYPENALNAYALAHLGRLALDEAKPADARALFATALEKYADGPLAGQCRLGLAESEEKLGQIDEARRDYEQLVEKHGKLADYGLLRLAALDNEHGDHAAALARLERLAKEHPQSPLLAKANLGRGYALYKLERYDEAEAVLAGLTKDAALASDAHYWLGMSQAGRKAWKEAAATFAAGVAIGKQHALDETLLFQAARALAEDGQLQAADAAFDQQLARWPEGAWADEAWFGKLQVSVARGDHAATVRLADEFAKKLPASPLLANVEATKGRALAAMGEHARAAAALEQSLAATSKPAGQTKTADTSSKAAGIAAHAETQLELAMSYARLGRFEDAGRIVQSLYDQKPAAAGREETCYHVAELAYAGDDLKTAGAMFALLARPGSAAEVRRRGLLGLGWCRFRASDWQGAAAAFDQLLKEFPDSSSTVEAALLRGRALEHQKDTAGALAMYRQVIDRHASNPRAAEALYRAARLCDASGQRTEAIELYSRLVSQHGDFGELDVALYRWAWLVRQDDPETADALLARLRHDFPASRFVADATLQCAERAFADKKYDEARAMLAEITVDKAPASIRQHGLYLLGRVAAANGDWAEVETSLARLMHEAPDSELSLAAAYLRAESSYRRGRYAESAERLTALAAESKARKQPWSAAAQLRRAQALAQLKQWSEALEVARAIEADFPEFSEQHEVDYVIGRCLAAEADLAGARAAYAKVVNSPRGAKTETAAMARWMTGETYFHQENYAAALAEYQRVDADYPFAHWRAAALLQIGKCHEYLGQWAAAVAAYERMLRDFPDSALAAEAARRVAEARGRVARRAATPH